MTLNICAFTGHRPEYFIFGSDESHPLCKKIKRALLEQCKKLYQEENVRVFYSGCALAADLWGAGAVLYLRDNGFPDMRLICAVPFPSHQSYWPIEQQQRLHNILSAANETVTVCESYSKDAYKRRNYYMIDRSQYLIAVFDHKKRPRSGTMQTVNYAESKGLNIIYIHPDSAQVTSELFWRGFVMFLLIIKTYIECCE